MSLILHLETATGICSVAISNNNELLRFKSVSDGYKHAENLFKLIDEVLIESHCAYHNLDAVAISAGPGSYTGLRIGVSAAKGICYGLGIPLIAVPTLKILAQRFVSKHPEFKGIIIPMIDARRMEVYTATFDAEGNQVVDDKPLILNENSFQEELQNSEVAFLGDGSEKLRPLIENSKNASFFEIELNAKGMISYAHEAYNAKEFADLAYFEPRYLKAYQGTPPPKGIHAGKQV